MKEYAVNFTATLELDIEAETKDEALSKAYEILDMREFEIIASEVVENEISN